MDTPYPRDTASTPDGGYAAAGVTSSVGPGATIYVLKTDKNGEIWNRALAQADPRAISIPSHAIALRSNPFTLFMTAAGHESEGFDVYDVSGRIAGRYLGADIGGDLAPGVYFLKPAEGGGGPLRLVKMR